MNRKVFVLILSFLTLIAASFAAPSLECQFRTGSCLIGEVAIFYANGNFYDASGEVLSSNVAISSDADYNRPLCCHSPESESALSVNTRDMSSSCGVGEVDFMFFTDVNNARVGFNDYDSSSSFPFDITDYSRKMCIKLPLPYGSVKLIASDRDYSRLGYTCLYKTTSMVNGLVSACDATFNGGNQYGFNVWGQIFESTNTLNCNSNCVSTTTNRIYFECREKLAECSGVPIECNGALLGSWVQYNNTHEIRCQREWNEYRELVFTNQQLNITTAPGDCENLISKKYSVIVSNEQVNMRVFICED